MQVSGEQVSGEHRYPAAAVSGVCPGTFVPGKRSAVSSRTLPVWALRALIRNDEARIEHLTQWVNSLRPGDFAPFNPDLAERLDAAHAKLVEHSTALRLLTQQSILQPA